MKNDTSMLQKIISVINGSSSIKAQNTVTAQKSLEQIFLAIETLSQKADGRLAEKYPEFSKRIKDLVQKVREFKPDVSTIAGKTEQSIAQKITCVSSSCDGLLSGSESNEMQIQLSDLERLVQQRLGTS